MDSFITIVIPENVKSNIEGYKFLSELLVQIKKVQNSLIILDFSYNKRFEANLCAILGSIVYIVEKKYNKIEYNNVSTAVKSVFAHNGFLNIKGSINQKIAAKVVTYKNFKNHEESSFKNYLDAELLSLPELPLMSDLLKKKINKSIFEIFNNAFSHGKCELVFTCGQYFPQEKRLDFTIVDLGKTVRNNVNNYLVNIHMQKLTSVAAISWAVEEGNTTKTGPIPGGLGLSLIREFLKLNKGRLQIISAKGYWEQNPGGVIALSKINYKFDGTIVNLEFNVSDTNSYMSKEEIDPSTIF